MELKFEHKPVKAFVGVIGSGKDFQSQLLINEHGYKQIAFADPLREMTWKLLGWKPETPEEYERFKASKLIATVGIKHTAIIHGKEVEFNNPDVLFKLTGREFLQNLGTTMREIDVNFWANLWQRDVQNHLDRGGKVVCSDCRYPNELMYVLSFGSKAEVVFCNYKSNRYDPTNKHASEKMAQRLISTGLADLTVLDRDTCLQVMES